MFGCLGFGAGLGYDATITGSQALLLEAFSAGYVGERMNVNIATLVNV